MIVEGQGCQVAPASIPYALTALDFDQAAFSAHSNAEKYRERKDGWGAGIIRTPIEIGGHKIEPHERAMFGGSLGELACYHILNRRLRGIDSMPVASIDWSKRATGDFGVDIRVLGSRLQVKTRQTKSQSERRQNCVKDSYQYQSDRFVFCEWLGGNDVLILGWLPTRHVEGVPLTDSERGAWKNHEIHDDILRPFQGLITELRIQGEKRGWR